VDGLMAIDAVEAAARQGRLFDVVLMDVHMPRYERPRGRHGAAPQATTRGGCPSSRSPPPRWCSEREQAWPAA
jgi:hypothetical protein